MPPLTINGYGKLVSNVGNHTASPRDFVEFYDLYTDAAGRIRKRPGIGPVKGGLAGAAVTAMHEYVYTDPSNGAETRWLFRATATTIEYLDRGTGNWVAITWPVGFAPTAGGTWVFENVPIGVTAICLACNGIDEMIMFDGTSWVTAGVEGPATALGYDLGGIYGYGTDVAHGSLTTVNATQGSPDIVGVGGPLWLTFADGPLAPGMKIDINGNRYEILLVPAEDQITLTENFKEANGVGLPYRVFYGPCSWEEPPRYAVAYEHPVGGLGHSSNIRVSTLASRNILELVERDQAGRSLTITGIPYSPDAFLQGYTRIRIYRSAKNANVLQALDTTIANSGMPGTTTFTESPSSFVDTFLLRWPAPETKLGKPPEGIIAIKYHQGRVYGLTRTRLYYSLHEADLIGEVGVAALSWPATQWISVNQGRGLVVMGGESGDGNLVVQTARGDYAVIGYDARTIALVKMPSRDSKTGLYGAIGTEGRIVAFDSDLRLRDFPTGQDYGPDIQNLLDAVNPAYFAGIRLHRFTSLSDDYLLLSVPKAGASTTNDITYVFDVDAGKWYAWRVGFTSFCTAENPTTGARELWASNSAGESYLLLQPGQWQDKGVNFSPRLVTSMIWPAGESEAVSDLVEAFTSDAALTWTGELLIDGQSAGAGAAIQFAAPRHQYVSTSGKVEWTPTQSVRNQSQPFQMVVVFPATATDVYLEQIAIHFAQATEGR